MYENKKVYLLDTSIVAEFSKDRQNPTVLEFYKARKNLCAISAITWQELVYGLSKLPEGRRKNYIAQCLKLCKDELPIIPYDSFSAEICGNYSGNFEKEGKSLPYADTQIAATAISNGMVLVTHNVADFAQMAERNYLKMEDWFEV